MMLLFALNASRAFGTAVASGLGLAPAVHEEREFEDGEHKARPLVDVRGADAYVVQSLHGGPDSSAHDKLARLLFFIATLKDHGAARVTAVVPYLAYARKDRRTKPGDPVTSRYVAQLFEAVGTDALITLETHNVAAFDNAFRLRAIHLDCHPLFFDRVAALAEIVPIAVVSPDPGGVKRVQLWREALEQQLGKPIGQAFIDKRRSAGVVSGSSLVVGQVENCAALILDDLVASGHTMTRAAAALKAAGARSVHAFAAHGLFVENAAAAVAALDIDRWAVTSSVPPFRLPAELARTRVDVVDAAPLFAAAIAGEAGAALSQPSGNPSARAPSAT
jgi:ribose-phosphate pyrophosphokinase